MLTVGLFVALAWRALHIAQLAADAGLKFQAYLAAGGSPVHSAAIGFGAAVETPQVPPAGLVARSVHAFPEDERLAVAIGGDGIAYRAGGCHACFICS